MASDDVPGGPLAVHNAFYDAATRFPSAAALLWPAGHEQSPETWSYATLLQLVDRICVTLEAAGAAVPSAQPNIRCIGIAVPRGPVLFASMLASWRLNAPVLLVEWNGPREREAQQLAIVQCDIFIVSEARIDRTCMGADAGCVCGKCCTMIRVTTRLVGQRPSGPGNGRVTRSSVASFSDLMSGRY